MGQMVCPFVPLSLVVHDGDLRAIAQLELAKNRADVVAHRALGQEETRRDIAVVHTLGNELGHRILPLREIAERSRGPRLRILRLHARRALDTLRPRVELAFRKQPEIAFAQVVERESHTHALRTHASILDSHQDGCRACDGNDRPFDGSASAKRQCHHKRNDPDDA